MVHYTVASEPVLTGLLEQLHQSSRCGPSKRKLDDEKSKHVPWISKVHNKA
jgi:hypothetical protein